MPIPRVDVKEPPFTIERPAKEIGEEAGTTGRGIAGVWGNGQSSSRREKRNSEKKEEVRFEKEPRGVLYARMRKATCES